MIQIVRGFGIINKAEVDVFLELSHFFNDPMDDDNFISGSFAFSKSRLNFWMYKLELEEAEEPEIKLPTSIGS